MIGEGVPAGAPSSAFCGTRDCPAVPARMVARIVALVALVALVGCRLDVAVDTEVRRDGTGVVRIEVRADAELLARAPSALGDVRLDDLRAAGWTAVGPEAQADGGAVVRLSKPFATLAEGQAILQSLNGPQGPLHDVLLLPAVEGGGVLLSATARLDGGVEAFADSALVQAAGGVPFAGSSVGPEALGLTVAVALPGEVTAPGATVVGGGRVAWTAPLGPGQATVISATGEWTGDGPGRFQALAVGALVALGIYVVGLVAWLGWRRRRT